MKNPPTVVGGFLCKKAAESVRKDCGFVKRFGGMMLSPGELPESIMEVHTMEIERNDFASKGVGAAGLTTGIIGTTLGAMASGIVPGLFGNNAATCHENQPVNRYEAAQAARIAELETEVKLRDANTYTLTKIGELRDYVDRRLDGVNASINAQAVINAQEAATLACLTGQINQLYGLTKLVVPNGSICPGWGDVTVAITPTTTPTTAG